MRRGIAYFILMLILVAALTCTLRLFVAQATPAVQPTSITQAGSFILDAGHGGEDGGAVSITGVAESGINLDIVRKMEDILSFYGQAPVLLRREDISLHDSQADTLREKKVSDLKNRVAAIEALPSATLISIHQNTYTDSRYRGAQVFYADTQGSQELAQCLQAALQNELQPENTRECKPIPDSVYLMNHISCRAVLVECGFLTNPEEEALLRDSVYQKKLAAVLSATCLLVQTQNETDGKEAESPVYIWEEVC